MGRAEEEKIVALEHEVESLRQAISLLHRIQTLVRCALEVEPTCYSVLTGVTAGIGLGLNRAMIFFVTPERASRPPLVASPPPDEILRGAAAIGPADAEEADRVWRAIEADAPDLETLYTAGLRRRSRAGNLDRRVRGTTIDVRGGSPVALALQRDALVVAEGDDDLGGLLDLPTAIAAPIRGRHAISGVLYADNRFTGRVVDPVKQTVFSMVADYAGRAIESARQVEALEREARTDALTGLGHHGAFKEELARAVAAALHQKRPLGLAMIDLDDFKHVNDTLGHPAGDTVLRGVADRMRAVVRARERPFRYGGEEFAVILYGADAESAARIGERLRRAVASARHDVGLEAPLHTTCSVGVASLPEHAHDADGLVAAADAALLRAKAHGKDRVEAA